MGNPHGSNNLRTCIPLHNEGHVGIDFGTQEVGKNIIITG